MFCLELRRPLTTEDMVRLVFPIADCFLVQARCFIAGSQLDGSPWKLRSWQILPFCRRKTEEAGIPVLLFLDYAHTHLVTYQCKHWPFTFMHSVWSDWQTAGTQCCHLTSSQYWPQRMCVCDNSRGYQVDSAACCQSSICNMEFPVCPTGRRCTTHVCVRVCLTRWNNVEWIHSLRSCL